MIAITMVVLFVAGVLFGMTIMACMVAAGREDRRREREELERKKEEERKAVGNDRN